MFYTVAGRSGAPGPAPWRSSPIRIPRFFYGWYIVGVAFLSLFMQASTGGFTFGIFLPAMSEDLGWSRSTIVLGASLSAITSAVAGPLLGRIVDWHGPRLLLALSFLGLGVAQIACGWVTDPWHFYLTFGLLSGAARAALQSVVPGAMIASWFIRRRSLAYGAAAMGPPVANVLLPPLIAALVGMMGWRVGWMGLGLVGIALGVVPTLLIVRRRPEDLGLHPDGDTPESSVADQAWGQGPSGVRDDWTAREAIHSPAFWMVAAGMALIVLAPNVSIIFMFSYLSSTGMEPSTAAAAVSAVSVMQVLSRLLFWAPVIGRLGSVRWALVLWGSILLCSSLLLALTQSEVGAFVAAGVLGLGLGGNLVLQLQVWPEYFGRSAIGTIIGTAQMLQGTTSAVVPFLLAVLLDHTGSYSALYLIVAALVLVGVTLLAMVGKPHRRLPVAAALGTG